jgi:uncharacterized protein (DUF1786 family)
MRAVLLFIRQRALLFAACRDHPVAFCESCRQGYSAEELGTDVGHGCYLCRRCGTDLRASVTAHARSCPNLTTPKPLMKMAARPDAQHRRYSRSASA